MSLANHIIEMVRPVADRIIVRQIDSEEEAKKYGVIFIPSTAQDNHMGLQPGEIVAVGAGARTPDGDLIPMSYKVGQIIYWIKNYAQIHPVTTEKSEDGTSKIRFYLMRESEIVAVD